MASQQKTPSIVEKDNTIKIDMLDYSKFKSLVPKKKDDKEELAVRAVYIYMAQLDNNYENQKDYVKTMVNFKDAKNEIDLLTESVKKEVIKRVYNLIKNWREEKHAITQTLIDLQKQVEETKLCYACWMELKDKKSYCCDKECADRMCTNCHTGHQIYKTTTLCQICNQSCYACEAKVSDHHLKKMRQVRLEELLCETDSVSVRKAQRYLYCVDCQEKINKFK